jgi:FkbM family methyltransferase
MYFADPYTFMALLMELFIEDCYKGCDPPDTILDLGSNIGMSILLFKTLWPTCSIYGVEASPDIFAFLQKNVQGLSGVQVANHAVSDSAGEITFYSQPGSLIGSTNSIRGGSEGKVVQAVPISELVLGPVGLLKIDIEGSEITAFAELEKSGKFPLIQQMYIEYHHHIPGDRFSLAAFLERLERWGYTYEVAARWPERYGDMQDIAIRAKRI